VRDIYILLHVWTSALCRKGGGQGYRPGSQGPSPPTSSTAGLRGMMLKFMVQRPEPPLKRYNLKSNGGHQPLKLVCNDGPCCARNRFHRWTKWDDELPNGADYAAIGRAKLKMDFTSWIQDILKKSRINKVGQVDEQEVGSPPSVSHHGRLGHTRRGRRRQM